MTTYMKKTSPRSNQTHQWGSWFWSHDYIGSFEQQQKDLEGRKDCMFPPHGGNPPSDYQIWLASGVARQEEKAGKFTHRAPWGGYKK